MKKVKQFRIYLCSAAIALFCSQGFSQGLMDNTQVRFFAQTKFSSSQDSIQKLNNTIQIGDIEMLLTAQITDNLSVLGEIIYSPTDGLQIDRLMLRYQFNDYFHISAGKLYSPIGIWNNTFYHQARVLTPTIDHPTIIADDADFGVLENKELGLQAGGDNISNIRFGYRIFLATGFTDNFGNTAQLGKIIYNFFIEPVDNLKFCISGERERLVAGSKTPTGLLLPEDNTINLMNASVMFLGGPKKFEFGSEYFRIISRSPTNGAKNINGFFVYAGYKINKFVPYFMYNRMDYQSGQEVYIKNNFTGSTIGIRYKITALAVLKLEAQFLEAEQFKKLNRVELMWAVGF